jgi:hypothetical protein
MSASIDRQHREELVGWSGEIRWPGRWEITVWVGLANRGMNEVRH